MSLTSLVTAFWLVLQPSTGPAEAAYQDATQKLSAGDAAGAEASAREALALSLPFRPEEEIGERPDKGLLFEDMILEAREKYRERRARYFIALGEALAAQESWRASRKAYARAAGMERDPALFLRMADDPDLAVSEQIDYLLDAYLTPGADRARIEEALLETGVFSTRNALKAMLDRRRFPELQSRFPDLELVSGAFPHVQAVTDAGTLNTRDVFPLGTRLVVYVPTESCARCSEELDGLTVPILEARRAEKLIEVAAFVPEADLTGARRIVRLLGMDVGVGRIDGLPRSLDFAPEGEIRLVARGGLTQVRIPMAPEITSGEIRRRVEAIFEFLDAPGLPTEEEPELASVPLVTLKEQVNEVRTVYEWIDQIEKLEAGPSPLSGFYGELRRLTQRVARGSGSREMGFDLLRALGSLRGAAASKTRALDLLGNEIGDRLLDEARGLDGAIRRTAPGEQGVFHVHVTDADAGGRRRIVMQRSFQAPDGLRHVDFLLEDNGTDLDVLWAALQEKGPLGVDHVSDGAVFRYEGEDDCSGLRVVNDGGITYDGCNATVMDGEVVELHPALIDSVEDGPQYVRRHVVAGGEDTALEQGLRLFREGEFDGAAQAFEAALEEIDPVAPYDASDLVYNRARALEESGQRQAALALYRSLGDVAYQDLVDEGAGRIEGAPR